MVMVGHPSEGSSRAIAVLVFPMLVLVAVLSVFSSRGTAAPEERHGRQHLGFWKENLPGTERSD